MDDHNDGDVFSPTAQSVKTSVHSCCTSSFSPASDAFHLTHSFSSVKNELLPSHPLELSEKNVSGKKAFCHSSFLGGYESRETVHYGLLIN